MTETVAPTTAQMRTWLRQNRPDVTVGRRGSLSAAAVEVYRQAHAPA